MNGSEIEGRFAADERDRGKRNIERRALCPSFDWFLPRQTNLDHHLPFDLSPINMSSLAAILAEARQLREIGSHHSLPSPPPAIPIRSPFIPAFQPTSSSGIHSELQSLGLARPLVDQLQQLYIQHLDSHRRCVESEYLQTAGRLQETMQRSIHLAPTLEPTIDLLLQTYLAEYGRFCQQRKNRVLHAVSIRLARQRGCQSNRPAQLGKSFSKARISFALLPSLPC
jgi:hypothetical protein